MSAPTKFDINPISVFSANAWQTDEWMDRGTDKAIHMSLSNSIGGGEKKSGTV